MTAFMDMLSGKKTYLAAGFGIIIILVVHFLKVPIPGVTIDDNNWMTDLWSLVLVMCGRSAVASVAPSA